MEEEKTKFASGLRVLSILIRDKSDMEYYFRTYGKIENYLFPSIRDILMKVRPNYTDYQQEFLVAFKEFVEKRGFLQYSTYFDEIPSNNWQNDYGIKTN
jgi:hypothetical protein